MKEHDKNALLKVIEEFQQLEHHLTKFRTRSKRPTNALRKALEDFLGCDIAELN